jgi:hypothetical protein
MPELWTVRSEHFVPQRPKVAVRVREKEGGRFGGTTVSEEVRRAIRSVRLPWV